MSFFSAKSEIAFDIALDDTELGFGLDLAEDAPVESPLRRPAGGRCPVAFLGGGLDHLSGVHRFAALLEDGDRRVHQRHLLGRGATDAGAGKIGSALPVRTVRRLSGTMNSLPLGRLFTMEAFPPAAGLKCGETPQWEKPRSQNDLAPLLSGKNFSIENRRKAPFVVDGSSPGA